MPCHHVICQYLFYKMADELAIFSLGFSFDPEVFFDLEDEKENEL